MNRLLVFFIMAVAFWTTASYAQDEPVRSIENVTGDLYRFSEGDTHGVFLVTNEGIILADPISHDNAVWLKGEFKERFGQEVKLVIYSHHHADHISGGEVFEETAIFVAHENAKTRIEEGGYTTPPDNTFKNNIKLELGGKRVELYYFYPSHTDNLIAIFFPEERTLFQVDSVGVKRLPYGDLQDYLIRGVNNSLYQMEQMDFDILVPGHGEIGSKTDLTDHKYYLQYLFDGIVEVLKNNGSVEDAKAEINLEKYKDWEHYDDWRDLNIEGAYRNFKESGYYPLVKKNPWFPQKALDRLKCGWVLVIYDLKADGTTENIRIIESEPKGYFEKSAIQAVKKYQYLTFSQIKDVKTRIMYGIQDTCRISFSKE